MENKFVVWSLPAIILRQHADASASPLLSSAHLRL